MDNKNNLSERPILRVQFLTQDGDTHQCTVGSSRCDLRCFTEGWFTGGDEASLAFRHRLTEVAIQFCAVLEVEFQALSAIVTTPESIYRMTEVHSPDSERKMRLIQGGKSMKKAV